MTFRKRILYRSFLVILFFVSLTIYTGCKSESAEEEQQEEQVVDNTPKGGQASVQDESSEQDVVKVAVASPDHTILVTALKAAGLVDVMASSGPYTVFAPVNAAFDALPTGTVDNLLKPENKDALSNVLQYHVAVAVYKDVYFKDGQKLGMANGENVVLTKNGDKWKINDANIVGSVMASNGIIYVIDKVLLPPDKK